MNPGRPDRKRAVTRGLLAIAMLALASSAAFGKRDASYLPPPLRLANSQIEPVAFDAIEGWSEDDHSAAFGAFLVSCDAILKSAKSARAARPLYAALYEVCRRAQSAQPLTGAQARAFFEQNFHGFRISPAGDPNGFITGYYEPIVDGARWPSDDYKVPLYRRPANLLMARLHRMGAAKGKTAWRKPRGKDAPYFDRAQIEDGAIAGRELEICYLKDPIDAFFAQIQGSTRVRLEGGSTLRLNYDATNGHPYVAVGKFLIERNIVPKEEMTMQRIRQWMQANPDDGKILRRENKSFVFFRETALADDENPAGGEGVALTPGRSIAVDRTIHTYGTPFFLDADLPIDSEKPDSKFRRLMIAQDTGGAIVGPARADIYFGTGEFAERVAGRLRHNGRFVMLLPKEINPLPARKVPLPKSAPVKEAAKVAELPVEKPAKAEASVPLPKARPGKRSK